MRELLTEDLYLISEILDKMDIKTPSDDKVVDGILTKKTKTEFGLEIGYALIRKIYKAKNEIDELLQNVFELTDEDMAKLTFKQTKDMLIELFKKEEITDFFK